MITYLEKSSLGVTLVDNHGADSWCSVKSSQLGGKTLVERKSSSLRRSIVNHLWNSDIRCQRSDCDDHSVVSCNQVWKVFLSQKVVCNGVNIECESDILLRRIQNGLSTCNTSVQNENSWISNSLADLLSNSVNLSRAGNIALEVVDIRWSLESHRNHIQNNDLDAALSQELDNLASDSTSASGDHDDLLGPDVVVLDAIVKGLLVEVGINLADQAEIEEELDALEGFLVEDGEIRALLCEAGEEDEWESEGWVEEGVLDEWAKNFRGEACRAR